MKLTLLLLALAVGVSPCFADAPTKVTSLRGASFVSPLVGSAECLLTVEYDTGGCGSSGHKTSYAFDVERNELKGSTREIIVHVTIYEQRNGNCRMAYSIKDSVDVLALFKQQAAQLGIDLQSAPEINISFKSPEVERGVYLYRGR